MTNRDDVGYRKPPKSHQFKPGESGNPRGRPKGSSDFRSDLVAELREEVVFQDKDGRSHKVTKQRAILKSLFSAALQNDKAAINTLLACVRYFGVDPEKPVQEDLELGDVNMVKAYLKRLEASIEHIKPDAPQKVVK